MIIRPIPPFRLDFTVWALRRRPRNAIDRWDGTTYRRIVMIGRRVTELAIRQSGSPAVSRADGTRFLVERLWPRGLSKERLHLASWLKEVGPSTELRQWFNHDPLKWSQFRTRYFRELDSRPESWRPILAAARRGMVTLVYSSHDEEHNNAVALKEYLRAKHREPLAPRRSAAATRARADR